VADLETYTTLLKRVTKRFPELTLDGLEDRILDGSVQLHPVSEKSVMVGQVYNGTVVEIFAAAGVLRELLDYEPIFCKWYRERGIRSIQVHGRSGWKKYLPALGYITSGNGWTKSLELH
jgi:hypothetical protein